MDRELLRLIDMANMAVCKAIRSNRLEEADRWARLMERYARSLSSLRRFYELERSAGEGRWRR
jgi:hypothetical protein